MTTGIAYTDAAETAHTFEEEAGAGGATRPVHGLPSGIVATFTAIQGAVEALAARFSGGKLLVGDSALGTLLTAISGYVDGLEGFVDGIEGKLDTLHADLGTTLAGYLDGVEGKLDTLHADLGTTLAGYLDGLEGYTDGLETKLDTIATNQGVPSGGFKTGQNTDIDTGAAEQFGSQALTRGLYVKNISTSGQYLYLGPTSGVASTDGWVLAPGETSPFIEATNATAVYMLPSANNAAACYIGY